MRTIHTSRLTRAVVAILSSAVLLSGCKIADAYQDQRRSQALENTVKVYIKAVRWGDYAGAAGLVRNRDGSVPEIDLASLADVRVVKSDHTLAATAPQDTEATMFATYEYYRDESTVVRRVSQQGTWWYVAPEDRWYFDGGLPEFANL